jgi:hypothetical protein
MENSKSYEWDGKETLLSQAHQNWSKCSACRPHYLAVTPSHMTHREFLRISFVIRELLASAALWAAMKGEEYASG